MFKIAVIGDFQEGKSSLINAFMGCHVAQVGKGRATTARMMEHVLPTGGVSLLDIPGFDSTVPGHSEETGRGISMADACIYLFHRELSARQLKELNHVMAVPPGRRHKLIIPVLNDRGYDAENVVRENIAKLESHGIQPLLFDGSVPIIHADKWARGDRMGYEKGVRWLNFLVGVDPVTTCPPIISICALYHYMPASIRLTI